MTSPNQPILDVVARIEARLDLFDARSKAGFDALSTSIDSLRWFTAAVAVGVPLAVWLVPKVFD